MPTIKEIDILSEQGSVSATRNIGAEAEFIDISKDTSGNIINKTDNATIEPLNKFLQKVNILGAKNLIKCNLPVTTNYNIGNLIGTVNNDFSVTLNGVSSSNGGSFLIYNGQPIFETFLQAGEYKFSGCPEGGSENSYYLYISIADIGPIEGKKDYGEGVEFILTAPQKIVISSYCAPNYVFNDIVFKPMITVIDEINNYNNYKEPSMSNKQLTREINNLTINKILPISKGGTGTKDGTINGVKLMKQENQYGYIDTDGIFHSFRQPTGNATAAQVLSGYTFSNESGDSIPGEMNNYSGNNIVITPSGGTGEEQLSLLSGYYNTIIVDRTEPYNRGVIDQQNINWEESWVIEKYNINHNENIPLNSISRFKITWDGDINPTAYWFNNEQSAQVATVIQKDIWYDVIETPFVPIKLQIGAQSNQEIIITVTRYANKLR